LTDLFDSKPQPDSFKCPECGKQFRWKPEFAGKRVQCKCGHKFPVPDLKASESEEPDTLSLDDLSAMEASAGQAEPAAELPGGNWMDQVNNQRKSKRKAGRSGQKADKGSRGGGGGGDWGKLHISDTLVFSIDVTGLFTKGGTGWSRIDFLVGYSLRCLILCIAAIALIAYAYKMKPIDEQFNANATPAVATIASFVDVDKEGRRKKMFPERWEFTYTVRIEVDGAEYTNNITTTKAGLPGQLDVNKPERLVGAELDVMYDAKNPSEIRLPHQKNANRFIYFVTIGWILVGIGGINAVLALLVVVRG